MPTTYAKNKAHIYAWRQKNIDTIRIANRKYKHKYDVWKKIQKEFLNILIE